MIGKILISHFVFILGWTSSSLDQKSFCDFLASNQLDSCQKQFDNYFALIHPTIIPQNLQGKFNKLDSLILYLNNIACIDTCFYRGAKGNLMKTNPPMTDIFIYKRDLQDTLKYLLRVRFDEPMKVVWIRKWNH